MLRLHAKFCALFVSVLVLMSLSPRCGRYGEAFAVATTVGWRMDKKSPSIATPSHFMSADAETQSCSSTDEHPDVVETESSEMPSIFSLSSSIKAEGYHLLWSPGAWKKLLFGSTTLFLAHGIGKLVLLANIVVDAEVPPSPSRGLFPVLRTIATNVILPLLASACCFLQLAMNMFALGCAGFNTVLGPIRPYFISLLLYLTVISRYSKHVDARHWAAMSALRWSIALLPEALHLWNSSYTNQGDSLVVDKVSANPVPRKLIATVQMNIPTMGCVACINSIDTALRQISRVQFAASSLKPFGAKGGQAEVRIAADTQKEVDAIVESLTAVVAQVGFPGGAVESVRVKQNLEPY
jgi:copper chaperone CopZ